MVNASSIREIENEEKSTSQHYRTFVRIVVLGKRLWPGVDAR